MGKLINKTLLIRTLSGVVLLFVVVFCILFSLWSFFALMTVICIGCVAEFYKLSAATGAKPQRGFGIMVGIALVAANFFVACGDISAKWLLLFLPVMVVPLIIELYRNSEKPLLNCATTLMGVIYAALPLALFMHIGIKQEEIFAVSDGFIGIETMYFPWTVLCYIFIVWANDIGAYLVGVSIGKHRLFERISPKKSWEGFFGGILFAVGTALLCGYYIDGNLLLWSGLGLVVSVFGVFGDLVESMFKREVGAKDSGAIMPGHGGFLDRFDALIFSLPFVYVYIILLF